MGPGPNESHSAPGSQAPPRPTLGDRAQAILLDAEREVQQVVEVLDRVQHRELDDLALPEVLAQRGKGLVRDLPVASRLLDVGQRRALALVEERARAPLGQSIELFEADVLEDRAGAPDVDAEAA